MTNGRELPTGWTLTTLGEISSYIQRGKSPKYTEYSELPIVNQKSVRWHGIEKNYLKYVHPEQWDSWSEERFLSDKDILWNSTGTGTLGRACVYRQADLPRAVVDTHVTILRLFKDSIIPDYVFYYIMSPYVQRNIEKMQSGSTNQVELGRAAIYETEIPLAPLPEQRRIVSKIEELFSDLDAGEASLRAVRKLLATYRQSVLKAAVTGELTREWRAANAGRLEPGAALLQRILAARRAQWGGRGSYEEPRAPDTRGLPELPEGWVWVKAEQVCDFITKGTTPAATKLFSGSGEIPYIKVYNLTDRGTLNFSLNPTFISRQTHLGELLRSRVYPGDVLMNIVGPPLGKVSIVPETYAQWNINQAIAIFRPLEGFENKFLSHALLSRSILDWAIRRAKATAGQFNLTLEICRDLPLPLPSLEEQEEIISIVEDTLSRIDALETWCATELARSGALRQSILKAAFSGQLVPQDPSDEPAGALLERIRAARAGGANGGGARRGRRAG